MKPFRQALLLTILTLATAVNQKDSDESRPYEFGFTIDGQQHRHEKKDENGIIQGEFGFITADGIYHVTVYATDENGNFKILSMKNIRISAPLDGSPLLGPISPEAGKYLGKQQQANVANVPSPGRVPPQSQSRPQISQQSQQPSSQPGSGPSQQVTRRPSAPYVFTTRPTIKPACGGCGYVTTAKPVPGQPFQFQNPAFQNPSNQQGSAPQPPQSSQPNYRQQKSQNLPENFPISQQNFPEQQPNAYSPQNYSPSQSSSLESPEQNLQGQLQSSRNNHQLPNQQGSVQNYPSQSGNFQENSGDFQEKPGYFQNQAGNYESQTGNFQNQQSNFQSQNFPGQSQDLQNPRGGNQYSVQSPNGFSQGNQQNQGIKQQPQSAYQGVQGQTGLDFGGNVQLGARGGNVSPFGGRNSASEGPYGPVDSPPPGVFGNNPNPLLQSKVQASKLPPVTVSDNVIHVAGNHPQDIPIQDKFPGMSDGLPEGIEEKDIKNILYKFHYTVGFHGHYETGLKNGAKIGGYFVNGRDGFSRVVTYVADENGYRPKFKLINLGLDSPDTPKEATEKTFGLKSFEFVWYPIDSS